MCRLKSVFQVENLSVYSEPSPQGVILVCHDIPRLPNRLVCIRLRPDLRTHPMLQANIVGRPEIGCSVLVHHSQKGAQPLITASQGTIFNAASGRFEESYLIQLVFAGAKSDTQARTFLRSQNRVPWNTRTRVELRTGSRNAVGIWVHMFVLTRWALPFLRLHDGEGRAVGSAELSNPA